MIIAELSDPKEEMTTDDSTPSQPTTPKPLMQDGSTMTHGKSPYISKWGRTLEPNIYRDAWEAIYKTWVKMNDDDIPSPLLKVIKAYDVKINPDGPATKKMRMTNEPTESTPRRSTRKRGPV